MRNYYSSCCIAEDVMFGGQTNGGDFTWMDSESCPECQKACKWIEGEEIAVAMSLYEQDKSTATVTTEMRDMGFGVPEIIAAVDHLRATGFLRRLVHV